MIITLSEWIVHRHHSLRLTMVILEIIFRKRTRDLAVLVVIVEVFLLWLEGSDGGVDVKWDAGRWWVWSLLLVVWCQRLIAEHAGEPVCC